MDAREHRASKKYAGWQLTIGSMYWRQIAASLVVPGWTFVSVLLKKWLKFEGLMAIYESKIDFMKQWCTAFTFQIFFQSLSLKK